MVDIINFGLQDYGEILNKQLSLFETMISAKKEGNGNKEILLIGEHNPVITMGRRAKEINILYSEDQLKKRGIKIFHVGRGGDVTYHCPGQLIVYPILDLEKHHMGVKNYVSILEESIIKLLSTYGIIGERIDGATGVWIEKGKPHERKICAIGIKCSRFCTMHGLALNVNSDLSGFSLINPCGFVDKGVTSMEKELGRKVDMKRLKKEFLYIFFSLVVPLEEVLNFSE